MWRWGRGMAVLVMGKRSGGTGEDWELGVQALKKTGYPHGRPVRFCHRSFHRREFFGVRGDGSMLFGNGRICTVFALVRGGAVLLLERGSTGQWAN